MGNEDNPAAVMKNKILFWIGAILWSVLCLFATGFCLLGAGILEINWGLWDGITETGQPTGGMFYAGWKLLGMHISDGFMIALAAFFMLAILLLWWAIFKKIKPSA
jgi:hypothetical protein